LAETFNRGTGRRKNAIARVRIQPGEGRITVTRKTRWLIWAGASSRWPHWLRFA